MGLRLSSAQASQNIVHSNYNGFQATGIGSLISENRVYNNTNFGIRAQQDTHILANQIYSNSVGIQGERINRSAAAPTSVA